MTMFGYPSGLALWASFCLGDLLSQWDLLISVRNPVRNMQRPHIVMMICLHASVAAYEKELNKTKHLPQPLILPIRLSHYPEGTINESKCSEMVYGNDMTSEMSADEWHNGVKCPVVCCFVQNLSSNKSMMAFHNNHVWMWCNDRFWYGDHNNRLHRANSVGVLNCLDDASRDRQLRGQYGALV